MTNLAEEKLIFIISQPRAGSTLLQRMLGHHSQIHTVAEPWIMLPTIYALRDRGYEAEYNSGISSRAIELFIQELPNKKRDFYDGIRLMYQFIYGRALQKTTKIYFLDKTPRYYYIVSELYSIFPKAKFIFLIRNPLDVLNSILNTWVKDNWYALHQHRDDLLKAPKLLLRGQKELGKNAYTIKYKQLISDPEKTISSLCDYIGVNFEPGIFNYNSSKMRKFELGDLQSVYKYKRPKSSNSSKWVNNIQNPQAWRLFKEYLEKIGENTFCELGYSYEECYQQIIDNAPHKFNLTISLHWLIRKPQDVRYFSFEWLFRTYFLKQNRLKQLVHEKGFIKTLLHGLKKIGLF